MNEKVHCANLLNKTYKELCEYVNEKNLSIQIVAYNNKRIDDGNDVLYDEMIYIELQGDEYDSTIPDDSKVTYAY